MGTRSGPVRSEAARIAILTSTARLFAELGYERLTIEGIAADAKVGKQTIYRWWKSKSELVAECLVEGMLLPERIELADTGDIRRDLTQWLGDIFDLLQRADTQGLLRSLIAAATENSDVARRVRDSLFGGESVTSRLKTAIGTVPNLYPGAPLEEIAEALVGTVALRALSRTHSDRGDAKRIASAALGATR